MVSEDIYNMGAISKSKHHSLDMDVTKLFLLSVFYRVWVHYKAFKQTYIWPKLYTIHCQQVYQTSPLTWHSQLKLERFMEGGLISRSILYPSGFCLTVFHHLFSRTFIMNDCTVIWLWLATPSMGQNLLFPM